MNWQKSELAPTQDLVYVRAKFCTELGRLYFQEIQIQTLTASVRSFSKVGAYKPAHQFLNLLGLMAAVLHLVEYAPLHMDPIPWYLMQCRTHTTHALHHPIFVSNDLFHVLQW